MTDAGSRGQRPLTSAAILAVGSELLTPTRLDTNSLFITEQLNSIGIEVLVKAVVGDERDEVMRLFHALRPVVDVIVFSGGLGPTDDDVTREAVAAGLNRRMSEDVAITERLRARFAARGFTDPMPEINRRQAMVPEGATVIENSRGSAPGLWLEDDGRVVLLLPGPPRELKPMLVGLIDGPLRARASGAVLLRRIMKIAGRVESQTDQELQPLYRTWAVMEPPIGATILAQLGQIELHVFTRDIDATRARQRLDAAVTQATGLLGEDVFSADERSLEHVVGDLLVERHLTIGIAESCTGGLVTSRLTDVAGSSRYVMQSVVTYSNQAKIELLRVPSEMIDTHGAVSEPVALAMADGIRASAHVDVGVGVTGIAGPGGGSPEKPVGMVAVAAVTSRATRSRVFRFSGEREQVKFQASQAALDMVRRMLIAP